jgi:hypothetical protein
VLPYLKAMGRLKDGVDVIEKSQLKGCEKTIYQMVKTRAYSSIYAEIEFYCRNNYKKRVCFI